MESAEVEGKYMKWLGWEVLSEELGLQELLGDRQGCLCLEVLGWTNG